MRRFIGTLAILAAVCWALSMIVFHVTWYGVCAYKSTEVVQVLVTTENGDKVLAPAKHELNEIAFNECIGK